MIKLAIDMGTSTTKIYMIGSGVVLAEASCVAVNTATGQIKAIGDEAKQLYGKTADGTSVVFPVSEGTIVDRAMAVAMLDEFLNRIEIRSGRRRLEVLFIVPCGISTQAKSALYNVCDDLGLTKISFAEVPYLSALGQDLPVSDSNPVFVMDIGEGTTNIGVISLDGIIAGLSLNIGGANIDKAIADFIFEQMNLKIGPLTSEKVKNTVGSLAENDKLRMYVNGSDRFSGRPRSAEVTSTDIANCIYYFVNTIIDYMSLILRKLPAEVSAGICHSGLYLSGGASQILGLPEYIAQQLEMEPGDVHLCDEPRMACILGAGKAIGNPTILKKIKIDF